MQERFLDGQEALLRLKAGNDQFLTGDESVRRTPDDIQRLSEEGQWNIASILGCADSRVKPSEIFGSCPTFSVRLAGNIPTDEAVESLALDHMNHGSNLIVVLGHTHCGAVRGVLNQPEKMQKQFPKIYDHFTPSLEKALITNPDDIEAELTRLNVLRGVELLHAQFAARELLVPQLLIVGGIVELENGGMVQWLENESSQIRGLAI